MIPLSDTLRTVRPAVVTKFLVAVNVVFFLHELGLGGDLNHFLFQYGIIPLRYTQEFIRTQMAPLTLAAPFITSLFLHGGWFHLITNMWVLWIFGDNVEDRVGSRLFLFFYLFFGITSSIAHILANPNSHIPTIGASGAIAGVMGMFFVFYPYARIRTLIIVLLYVDIWEVPAFLFLSLWFLTQFLSGALSLTGNQGFSAVAWWAHIGGFISGMLVAFLYNGFHPHHEIYIYEIPEAPSLDDNLF